MASNNKIFEAPSFHKNSQKEFKEKELIKQNQQEDLKKAKEQLKIIEAIEQDQITELIKNESISLINEFNSPWFQVRSATRFRDS